jgi:putative nucleotidyltransferase with HDIG domain
MYIHDLNVDWMKHPFIRPSFMLREESDLARIFASGIEQVWIDTVKGLDTAPEPGAEPEAGPEPGRVPPARARTPFLEELPTAKRILREARRIIYSVLMDVRMGRQVRVGQLQPVVMRITGSILRSPGTLVSLCRLREADRATYQHSISSCALLVMFGQHLGMDEESLLEVGMGGMLHDLGKMRVPDHILNKPGKLTDSEYAIMRSHVRLGLETLAQTPGITTPVIQVAAEHHERCDGSGYPNRLTGGQISQLGRMASIVDVYDATTSNRIYHQFLEPAPALRRLFERAPREFDLDLVQQFIQAIGIYPAGSLVRLKSDRLAVVVEQTPGRLLWPKVRVVYDLARDQGVPPFDLDLAPYEGGDEAILGYEDPVAWSLDPNAYLNLELG